MKQEQLLLWYDGMASPHVSNYGYIFIALRPKWPFLWKPLVINVDLDVHLVLLFFHLWGKPRPVGVLDSNNRA